MRFPEQWCIVRAYARTLAGFVRRAVPVYLEISIFKQYIPLDSVVFFPTRDKRRDEKGIIKYKKSVQRRRILSRFSGARHPTARPPGYEPATRQKTRRRDAANRSHTRSLRRLAGDIIRLMRHPVLRANKGKLNHPLNDCDLRVTTTTTTGPSLVV